MKRVISAAVLLIFVLTVYFTGFFYIKKTCAQAREILSECNVAYKNQSDAASKAKELESFWSNKEPMLSVFANHMSIDEIELAISTLAVYSKTKEEELFYEYLKTVETLLHQLMEDTVPSVHSIL